MTLIPVSLAWGGMSGAIFRRFSDRPAVRTAANRMVAHVLEFRLFLDEPKLVLRAQRDLLRANAMLLCAIAVPTLLTALPLALAFPTLDRFYGHGPLEAGAAVVITGKAAPRDAELKPPSGVIVETPAVRAVQSNQVSWRVRPMRPFSGKFELMQGQKAAIEVPWPPAFILGAPWWLWFALFSAVSFKYFA